MMIEILACHEFPISSLILCDMNLQTAVWDLTNIPLTYFLLCSCAKWCFYICTRPHSVCVVWKWHKFYFSLLCKSSILAWAEKSSRCTFSLVSVDAFLEDCGKILLLCHQSCLFLLYIVHLALTCALIYTLERHLLFEMCSKTLRIKATCWHFQLLSCGKEMISTLSSSFTRLCGILEAAGCQDDLFSPEKWASTLFLLVLKVEKVNL